jgi:hypothetical protein
MRVTINGVCDTSPSANVFWVRNGNASQPTFTDLNSVAADVANAFVNLLPNLSERWHGNGASWLYWDPSGEASGGEVPFNVAGGSTGPVAAANVACCITWQVQTHYKGGHPRTYLAGIPDTGIQDNTTWVTAYRVNIAAAANQFHFAVNAISHGAFSSSHLGTVSFQLNKLWRDQPVFRDFVHPNATVDSRIDSQRRRLGRDR